MKKRILHLITGLELESGAENFLLKLLPALKNTENAVCCIKGMGKIGEELEKQKIKVFYLKLKNILDFPIIFRYKQALKNFKPDVQVNYLIHADFFGRIFGKLFGIKKIISFNRLKYTKLSHRFLDKISFNFVDYLITNSKTNLDYYKKKYGIKSDKCSYIPNGVLLDRFNFKINKSKKRKEFGLSNDDFVLCCVARLDKQKDHKTLFKAIKKIKEDKLKLILCGKGKEKNNLLKLKDGLGLKNKIIFLGNRNDVLEILKAVDVFILPSLYEGMSNALLEAMASGCGIIVSDIPENKELIIDGYNGLTFKVGDERDLANKIYYLICNKELIKTFGNNAKKTAINEYDFNKIVKNYEEIIKNL